MSSRPHVGSFTLSTVLVHIKAAFVVVLMRTEVHIHLHVRRTMKMRPGCEGINVIVVKGCEVQHVAACRACCGKFHWDPIVLHEYGCDMGVLSLQDPQDILNALFVLPPLYTLTVFLPRARRRQARGPLAPRKGARMGHTWGTYGAT